MELFAVLLSALLCLVSRYVCANPERYPCQIVKGASTSYAVHEDSIQHPTPLLASPPPQHLTNPTPQSCLCFGHHLCYGSSSSTMGHPQPQVIAPASFHLTLLHRHQHPLPPNLSFSLGILLPTPTDLHHVLHTSML